ncbi:MAG: LD-carboxypeptidase, partial [Nocardioides sp.]|nr:LD-carboxypeptidase [Nocardioides sp.]
LLDLAAMEAAGPCLLVGFSDVTALHTVFGDRLGVATLHAPGVAGLGELDDPSRERVRECVVGAAPSVLRGRWLVSAEAEVSGPLVGGNLALLASAAGTPDAGRALAAVALLEDVAEPPYRVDRMVTQLLRSGWFDGVRAVVCGDFTRCGDPAEVEAVLRARLGGVAPVLVGLPVGHGPVNEPILLGARARLTPDGTLHVAGLR